MAPGWDGLEEVGFGIDPAVVDLPWLALVLVDNRGRKQLLGVLVLPGLLWLGGYALACAIWPWTVRPR